MGETPTSNGLNTGSLSLTGAISTSLASLSNLEVLDPNEDALSVIHSGTLIRQVTNFTWLADVKSLSTGGFEVKFYGPGSFGTTLVSGLYPINAGAAAGKTITYTPIAAVSGTHFGGLRVSSTGPDQITQTIDYLSTSGDGSMYRVSKNDGAEVSDFESFFSYYDSAWHETVTETIHRNGTFYAKNQKTYLYQIRREDGEVSQTYKFLLEQQDFPAVDSPLITTWQPDPDFIGKAQSVTRPDGSWEVYHYYSGSETGVDPAVRGRLKEILRPWNGLPTTAAGADSSNSESTTIVYTAASPEANQEGGFFVAQRTTTVPGVDGPIVIHNKLKTSSASDISVWFSMLQSAGLDEAWVPTGLDLTERTYGVFPNADDPELIYSHWDYYSSSDDEEKPWTTFTFADLDPSGNGSVTGYQLGIYNPATGSFTPGNPASSPTLTGSDQMSITLNLKNGVQPVPGEATKTVIIRDYKGHPYRRELWVMDASSVWNLATTTIYEYPTYWSDGSPRSCTVKKDGRIVSQWSQLSSLELHEIDQQGIETDSTDDTFGRPLVLTRKGAAAGSSYAAQPDMVTSYSYGGRTTTETTSAGGISRSRITAEDFLGRTISETNESGAITYTSYPNGGRDTTITHPGGLVETTERTIDGKISSVYGSAVIKRVYSYEVTESGNLVTTVAVGNVTSSPRYTTIERDWAKRIVTKTNPSPTGSGTVTSTYGYDDGTNRLASLTSPTSSGGSVTKFFAQPTSGSSLSYTGYDVNADNVLATNSTDRVAETSKNYQVDGGYVWEVSTKKVYDVMNSSASAISQISKSCLYGAPGGFSSQSIEIAPSGETTTVTTAIDRANKVSTRSEVSSSSSIAAVTVNVNGLVVSKSGHDTATPTRWTYNSIGDSLQEVSPRGAISLTSYNSDGSVASTTDPYGKTTSYTYYAQDHISAGKISVITDPNGKTTEYTYDGLGHVTKVAGTASYRVDYEYDDYGALKKMLTWRTTGSSDSTQWGYQSGTGLLTSKTDAAGKSVTYTYNASGKLATRTWARGVTTSYGYDAYGDLTSITYPTGTSNVTLSGYDRLGRPTSVTQNTLNTETYVYFPGRLECSARYYASGHTLLPGLGIRYSTPDGSGRPTGFMETSGSNSTVVRTVGYTYDSAGRLSAITDGTQSTVYGYQADSSLIDEIQSQNSGTMWFRESRANDKAGRLIGIRSYRMSGSSLLAGISTYSYDYDALGRRTKSTLLDGSNWNYGYNDHSEVTDATRKTAGGTTISPLTSSYSYDGIGNRLSSSSGALGDRTYTSNSLNQYSGIANGNSRTVIGRADSSWTVNVAGTAASRSGDLFYRSVTASNASTSVWQSVTVARSTGTPSYTRHLWYDQASVTPAYDYDGNLTNDGRWTYTWDAENRLTSMVQSGSVSGTSYTKLTFSYDWQGRRIARNVWVGGTSTTPTFSSTRRWIYDGWNPVVEFSATSDIATSVTRLNTFTWGLDLSDRKAIPRQSAGGVGGLLYQKTVASGAIERASYDGNGNIISWTNSTATNPTYRCEYDAFGNTVVSEGTAPCSFGFSTKMQDAETGLYYYGYRYYSARDGGWVSRDPYQEKGGLNLYSFVTNNAVNFVDMLGLHLGDPWFGYNNRDFQDWYHKRYKSSGDPDVASKEEMDEIHQQWKDAGKPKRDWKNDRKNSCDDNKDKDDDNNDDDEPPPPAVLSFEEKWHQAQSSLDNSLKSDAVQNTAKVVGGAAALSAVIDFAISYGWVLIVL